MTILSAEIQEFVRTQKLGFVATVSPDGSPNVSPKGTTTVWDDDHLVFADIHSPGTTKNLLNNPRLEINIVDVFLRKGYRFKGTAQVISEGPLFNNIRDIYGEGGKKYNIRHFVLMKVDQVLPLISPAYDSDPSGEEIRNRWTNYWGTLYPKTDS